MLRHRSRDKWSVELLKNVVVISLRHGDATCAVVVDLFGNTEHPFSIENDLLRQDSRQWHLVLSSNEERFGGEADTELFSVPTTAIFNLR